MICLWHSSVATLLHIAQVHTKANAPLLLPSHRGINTAVKNKPENVQQAASHHFNIHVKFSQRIYPGSVHDVQLQADLFEICTIYIFFFKKSRNITSLTKSAVGIYLNNVITLWLILSATKLNGMARFFFCLWSQSAKKNLIFGGTHELFMKYMNKVMWLINHKRPCAWICWFVK